MPSQSKQQQKFMGMVHALKKGDIEPSSVSKSVKDAAKSMSKKDAKDFASTKHKGLPKKVKQEILNKLKELNESVKKSDYISGLKDLQKVVKSEKGPFKGNNGGKIAKNYYEKALKMGMDNKFIDNLTRKRINSYNKKAFGLSGGSLHNAVVGGIDLLLKNINEYANKMGRDHLGGDDYTSKRKGGLRDFDGYDNVDYNKDMPMDEGFKSEYEGNDGIIWKKGKSRGGVTNFTPYYKGHNIDYGGHNFKTEKELKDFIKDYILSNQLYRKYRNEATKGDIMRAVKGKSNPYTLVVIKRGDVIYQKDIKNPQEVPAVYSVIRKHMDKGEKIHIEDRTGKIVFKESINERADYKFLTQTILDAKPKHNVHYNSAHNKVNIGGVGYDGGDLVKNFNQKPGSSSKIKNNFYYADQDPQKTKREVEKLSKGKIKVDIQKGYGGKPMAVYIVKESVNEGVNEFFYMEFKKWAYQHRAKINRLDKEDKIELLSKAYLKKYGKYHRGEHPDYIGAELLYLLAKDRILKESKGVPQNYMQGRTSDYHTSLRGKKKDYSGGTNFKKTNHGQPDVDEEENDQSNPLNNKQIALKKEDMSSLSSSEKIELYKLYSKAMKAMPGSPNQKKIKVLINKLRKKADLKPLPEYGQRLDLSFIEDEEARLDGTPKPKDAINRDLDEGTMIRLAGQIAQELLPKDTWSRFSNDGRKNKEFVKTVVKDLAQTLNRFYKSHNISVRIKENNIELNEIGVFDIKSYVKGIIPSSFFNTTTRDKKEKLQSTLRDLKSTLNHFWKQHKIPYRIR